MNSCQLNEFVIDARLYYSLELIACTPRLKGPGVAVELPRMDLEIALPSVFLYLISISLGIPTANVIISYKLMKGLACESQARQVVQ